MIDMFKTKDAITNYITTKVNEKDYNALNSALENIVHENHSAEWLNEWYFGTYPVKARLPFHSEFGKLIG